MKLTTCELTSYEIVQATEVLLCKEIRIQDMDRHKTFSNILWHNFGAEPEPLQGEFRHRRETGAIHDDVERLPEILGIIKCLCDGRQ